MNKTNLLFGVTVAVLLGFILIPSKKPQNNSESSNAKPPPRKPGVRSVSNNSDNSSGAKAASGIENTVIKQSSEGRRIDIHRAGNTGNSADKLLSLADIARLGEQFKNEKDPELRREIFDQLIAGMTAENALDIRKYIADLPHTDKEFIDFHMAYGAVAGATAVVHGESTKKPDMAVTLKGWAIADPAAAIEWYNQLEGKNKAKYSHVQFIADGMMRGLVATDSNMATEFLLSMNKNTRDDTYRRMSQILAGNILKDSKLSGDLSGAQSWTEALPDGKLRTYAQGMVVYEMAGKDPQKAIEWLENTDIENSKGADHAFEMTAKAWAKKDATAAVEWLGTLDDSNHNLGRSYYSAFSAWAGKDAEAAGQYIQDMPNSKNKDSAITGLSINMAQKDPKQAMQWAADIQNSDSRMKALMYTSHIGFRKDTEGLKKWLPSSGLDSKSQEKILKNHYKNRKRR